MPTHSPRSTKPKLRQPSCSIRMATSSPLTSLPMPPTWTVDQPSTVGIGAGPQPQDELVTGLAPTNLDAVLSVSVPGVVNPNRFGDDYGRRGAASGSSSNIGTDQVLVKIRVLSAA
jgi:hypothetical protein